MRGKFVTRCFWILWFGLAITMAVFTRLEQTSAMPRSAFYAHPVFVAAWLVALLLAIVLFVLDKRWKSVPDCLLCAGVVLIFAAALFDFGNVLKDSILSKILMYTGFAFFMFGYVCKLFRKDGAFRKLCRKLMMCALGVFLFVPSLYAQRTVNKEDAVKLGRVAVWVQGREAPFQSVCDDWLRGLYGKTHYGDWNSVQVAVGWLFYPEDWWNQPFVKIEKKAERELVGVGKFAAPCDFFTVEGNYRFEHLSQHQNLQVETKLTLLQQMRAGTPWRMFPENGVWYALSDLSSAAPITVQRRMNGFCGEFCQCLTEQKTVQNIVNQLIVEQNREIRHPRRLQMELVYDELRPWLASGWFCLAGALLSFLLFLTSSLPIAEKRIVRHLKVLLRILLWLSALAVWLHWGVRWFLARHVPLTTGYDTLLFMAAIVLTLAIIFRGKDPLTWCVGYGVAGFCLIVSNFPFLSPAISSLSPALDSPWLAIHVTTVMLAYVGFALLFALSCVYFIMRLMKKEMHNSGFLTDMSRLVLFIAVGFLAAGIMFGAIWGERAWGSYWNWDPKEVWALVTWMVYVVPLQCRTFPRLQSAKAFHFYLMAAFAFVLMTYFGVNLLLGGQHIYQ